QLGMVAGGPLVVDLARARVEVRAAAAHPLDDAAGVRDEHLRVVHRIVWNVEERRRSGDRGLEPRRIHLDAVAPAEGAVPLAVERRARIDQREVDVEEHRARRHSAYGPATTTVARSTATAST